MARFAIVFLKDMILEFVLGGVSMGQRQIRSYRTYQYLECTTPGDHKVVVVVGKGEKILENLDLDTEPWCR